MKRSSVKISSVLFSALTAYTVLAPALAANDVYQVVRGDSLSKIAQSRFGKIEQWKDLWKLNQSLITNPDLIFPGQRLRILGSGQIEFFDERLEANNTSDPEPRRFTGRKNKRSGRSTEWLLLPRQSWDWYNNLRPSESDSLGFDRRSQVGRRFINKTTAKHTISTDIVPISGEILYSRSEHKQIFMGEQVFIRADEELQVGNVYSVTQEPEKLKSDRDGRVGFSYELKGKVKIIGVRDNNFIATVIDLQSPIHRKDLLIPEVKSLVFPNPIASSAPIEAQLLSGHHDSFDLPGDQHLVFLDVGTADGVAPGVVFRQYLHKDPVTGDEISTSDFLIETQLLVLEASEQFSTAIVLNTRGNLTSDSKLTSLTDVSDLDNQAGMQVLIQSESPVLSTDALDQLDQTQDLGENEQKELRQLENWSQVPEEIKREYIHSDAKKLNDLGSEVAPNDGSGSTGPIDDQRVPEMQPDTNTDALPESMPEPLPEPTVETSTELQGTPEPAPYKRNLTPKKQSQPTPPPSNNEDYQLDDVPLSIENADTEPPR
jgi:hypothetical protein